MDGVEGDWDYIKVGVIEEVDIREWVDVIQEVGIVEEVSIVEEVGIKVFKNFVVGYLWGKLGLDISYFTVGLLKVNLDYLGLYHPLMGSLSRYRDCSDVFLPFINIST